MIADELKAAPERSDRAIGSGLGVDGKTVASVRDDLESTAEIPQLEVRKGRDDRLRKMVQYVDPSPEGVRGTKARRWKVDKSCTTGGRAIQNKWTSPPRPASWPMLCTTRLGAM